MDIICLLWTFWIFLFINIMTMDLAQNIKALREQKGLLQKQVATEIGLGISHYNKIENGQREASVEMLDKLAKFYGISIDQIVHPDNEVPTEVVVEDKTLIEQVRLINGLDEKDKNVIFSMLETMITKQKFKDFFNKNVAVL